MKNKKYIVYLSVNLINDKKYIGDHSTNNLDDGYLGSGILIKKAIKKYGRENFKREILEFFSSKQEAFDAQEKYIKEYNTLQPNGYNISKKGGHQSKEALSEETKEKIRKSVSGENNFWFGKKHTSETILKCRNSKLGYKNPFYLKHHSGETKEKIKRGNLNKYVKPETRKKLNETSSGKLNSQYIHKKYIFLNIFTKEIFEGTPNEFRLFTNNNPDRKSVV